MCLEANSFENANLAAFLPLTHLIRDLFGALADNNHELRKFHYSNGRQSCLETRTRLDNRSALDARPNLSRVVQYRLIVSSSMYVHITLS